MAIEVTNYLLLVASVVVFGVGVWRLRNPGRIDLWLAAVAIPLFLLYTLFFLGADYFTGKGVDGSVVYHIEYGLEGAGFDEFRPFIAGMALGVVLIAVGTWFILRRLAKRVYREEKSGNVFAYLALLAAFILSPTTFGLAQHFSAIFAVDQDAASEDFRAHYRKPELVSGDGEPRNLVVIYAESLERSYFDDAEFPGLAPRLKDIEKRSTTFLDIGQVYGTYWTIAGIVASQCGIPLVTPSHGNSMTGVDHFLPNAVCLPELLTEYGYRVGYLSGSSLQFAGTGKFFETHGYGRVVGAEQLKGRLPDDTDENGWGFYDDVLLDFAFEEISDLADDGEPYAYFISTMDTHHPGENVSRSCDGTKYADGANSILNAVACADLVISQFIERIRASEFGRDVVVVLASDHLAMRNSASDRLNHVDRRNLLMINEPKGEARQVPARGTMMDFAPTVAPFIGFQAQVGLGRNLLAERSLRDELGEPGSFKAFNQRLMSWDRAISEFWGFPVAPARGELSINPGEKTLRIAGRAYGYPLLIEFSENLETSIRFDSDERGMRLADFVENMEPGTPFAWLQYCAKMGSLLLAHWGYETCLMAGRAGTAPIWHDVVKENTDIEIAAILEKGESLLGRRSEAEIRQQAADPQRFIAHAGGGIDGHTYTNSLDALERNYANGFRLFELDIIETSDHVFVAAHDWDHWKKITGFEGEVPPSRETFLAQQIHGRYAPMDIDAINDWFSRHDDAVLVTDKVNRPIDFAAAFVDPERLMMELFSVEAIEQAKQAGIRSAMLTGDLLAGMSRDPIKTLNYLKVKDVALSRRVIRANLDLLDRLRKAGIRVYVFHVGQANRDETWVVCRDMDVVYGLYADRWDFETSPECAEQP